MPNRVLCLHGKHFLSELKYSMDKNLDPQALEQVANGVVHSVIKETIIKYKKLIQDPLLREIWMKGMAKELGRLALGYGDEKVTNTVQFMDLDEIANISKGKNVTYANIVVDYCPQKKDPNRVRITVGGNLIRYSFELTTYTADLTISKIL